MIKIFRRAYDDSYFATFVPPFIQQIAAKAKIVKSAKAGGDLLEIGCGDGSLLREVADHFRVTGIEISPFALKKAKQAVLEGELRLMDIEGGELDKKYDVIVAIDILEHLKEPAQTVAKIKRALKKGGVFIFSTANNYGLFGRIATAVGNYFDKTHVSTLPRKEWFNMIESFRLEPVAIMNKTWFGFGRKEYTKHFASNFLVVFQNEQ
ncbi:MAG: class I SAM-dependent methyltransferase [Candidatus Wildermuthbacteria bacterium]|nr:class I SAM-dependent methyltransferase [Candidatus Wildermuthbacteria bacterium]